MDLILEDIMIFLHAKEEIHPKNGINQLDLSPMNEISEWKHLPRCRVKITDHGRSLPTWAPLRLKSIHIKAYIPMLQFYSLL